MTTRFVLAVAVVGLLLLLGAMLSRPGNLMLAFGRNNRGQLGDGTTIDRARPVVVAAPPRTIAVAGGGEHALALSADGALWGWGGSREGQLGGHGDRPPLAPVEGIDRLAAVPAGDFHPLAP